MDAYKTIISKRDTRQFSDKPVSEESLRRDPPGRKNGGKRQEPSALPLCGRPKR